MGIAGGRPAVRPAGTWSETGRSGLGCLCTIQRLCLRPSSTSPSQRCSSHTAFWLGCGVVANLDDIPWFRPLCFPSLWLSLPFPSVWVAQGTCRWSKCETELARGRRGAARLHSGSSAAQQCRLSRSAALQPASSEHDDIGDFVRHPRLHQPELGQVSGGGRAPVAVRSAVALGAARHHGRPGAGHRCATMSRAVACAQFCATVARLDAVLGTLRPDASSACRGSHDSAGFLGRSRLLPMRHVARRAPVAEFLFLRRNSVSPRARQWGARARALPRRTGVGGLAAHRVLYCEVGHEVPAFGRTARRGALGQEPEANFRLLKFRSGHVRCPFRRPTDVTHPSHPCETPKCWLGMWGQHPMGPTGPQTHRH